MIRQGVHILALLAASLPVAGPALADGSVVVAARESLVSVVPRDARLRLVNLPAIEFGLRAALRCSGAPTSLTISISDTFRSIGAERLDGQRAVELSLEVPPRQLALASPGQFCISDDDNSANEMLVTGFATAHASLRCEKDGVSTMHFASAPLQLRLVCERPAADGSQEDSADTSPEDM